MQSICSDFLERLKVPFTQCYTDRRFETMPYAGTLKGFADLLDEYDVATDLRRFDNTTDLTSYPVPFMAMILGKLVIVTKVTADKVTLVTDNKESEMDRDDFVKRSNRKALIATPTPDSHEPEMKHHRQLQIVSFLRTRGIVACLIIIAALLVIFNGLWRDWPTALVGAFDIAGIYICYLLLGKQLHISNSTGEAICGFLEKGGCGKIMERNVSKIFGVIGWGEVGMAYFSVSLIAMIACPPCLPYLAFFNACCLPYTVWSISYQKFVAKTWCTLCVTVQTLQWLLFGAYLLAHAWHGFWPLQPSLFILGFCYLLALLVIDRVLPIISDAHSYRQTDVQFDNLRLRTEVFEIEQQQQPETAPTADGSTIAFGPADATGPSVAVFVDPVIEDGAALHREIDILLKKGLRVCYMFLTDTPEREQIARSIIALYQSEGADSAFEVLGKWASDESHSPDFFRQFVIDPTAKPVSDEIARQRAWQQASYIFAAPTVVVNNRLLNLLYSPTDLVYIY